jgi:hypothetical protein
MKLKTQRDHEYFDWLTSQIAIPERNPNTYHGLFERMHETEFLFTVIGDDNRVQDARDLRVQFSHGSWRAPRRPISVLEILIAVSRRTAFICGGIAEEWAWNLLENLKLNKASDPLGRGKLNRIDETLEALIWRTYEYNGRGGFFPLRDPKEDQTKVEIWFQMNAYALEIMELDP